MSKLVKGLALVAGGLVSGLAVKKIVDKKKASALENLYIFGPDDEFYGCVEMSYVDECHNCGTKDQSCDCSNGTESKKECGHEDVDCTKMEAELKRAFAGTDFLKEIEKVREENTKNEDVLKPTYI